MNPAMKIPLSPMADKQVIDLKHQAQHRCLKKLADFPLPF
jgi:hypothetical protein